MFIAHLVRRSKRIAQANAGVAGCGVHADLNRLGQHGCLQVKRIGAPASRFSAAANLTDVKESSRSQSKVAVRKGVAVREVVVASVGVQELLVVG